MLINTEKAKILHVNGIVPRFKDTEDDLADTEIHLDFSPSRPTDLDNLIGLSQDIISSLVNMNYLPNGAIAANNHSEGGPAFKNRICVYTIVHSLENNLNIRNIMTLVYIPSVYDENDRSTIVAKLLGRHKLNIISYFHLLRNQFLRKHMNFTNFIIAHSKSEKTDFELSNIKHDALRDLIGSFENTEDYYVMSIYDGINSAYEDAEDVDSDLSKINGAMLRDLVSDYRPSSNYVYMANKIFRGITKISPILLLSRIIELYEDGKINT